MGISRMRGALAILFFTAAIVGPCQTHAVEFKAEIFAEEKTIPPGPNVFANETGWDGASRIHIYGQHGLTYKGELSLGLNSQLVLSPDGKQVLAFSNYMKRYTYGPVETALQVFDVATARPLYEIIVPSKAVEANPMSNLIARSDDGHYVYIQNATPATSVTVVDMTRKSVIDEVPLPGCYGIMPARQGLRFATLCGTGKIKTVAFREGKHSIKESAKLFDVKKDALFIHSQRARNGLLVLTSFQGNLYLIDDSQDTAKLVDILPIARDIPGHWVPGGYQVSAYNAPHDVLFLLMHPNGREGSHKDPSQELFAYSLADHKVIARSKAPQLTSIVVTQDEDPLIYGSNKEQKTIVEYTQEHKGSFVFRQSAMDGRAGGAKSLAVP